MSKTLEELSQELDSKIPRDVVSLRDGGGGRKLSYLEGHYVIDRLNKVFGHMNWSKEITDVRLVENTTSKGTFPAYVVKVRLTVGASEGEKYKTLVKEGYGYGSDKSGQNAHELAIKEAVTDALKVAAKDLGMSMGLALYDKTQENVDDGEEHDNAVKRVEEPKVRVEPGPSPTSSAGANGAAPAKLEEAIKQYVKVAVAQKRLTVEEFKAIVRNQYNAEKLSSLSASDLTLVLDGLKTLTK